MHLAAIFSAVVFSAAALVSADWEIITTTFVFSAGTTFSNVEQASKWEEKKLSEISKAISTYLTHVTAEPQYASVTKILYDELATATDVPDAVLGTGTTTTYTTVPAWFTRLPKDVQSYYNSVNNAELSIFESVVKAAAARPTPGPVARMGVYGAAGFAALGAAGGLLL